MKKTLICMSIVTSTVIMAADNTSNSAANLGQSAPAVKDGGSKLADVSIGASYTNGLINEIKNVEIKTDPILVGSLKATILPGEMDISLGYSRTFTENASESSGQTTSSKQAVEQMNIEVPLKKIGLLGWSVLYDKYTFNTTLTPMSGTKVAMIDKSNTTAASDTFHYTDAGVALLGVNDNGKAVVKRERLELRKYMSDKQFAGADGKNAANNSGTYLSLYGETLEKPFEDPTAEWYERSTNIPLTVIYSQAKFTTAGIGFGNKIEDRYLSEGLNLSKLNFDFGLTKVDLTQNYSLNEKLGKNITLARVSMGAEIAHKTRISALHGDLVLAAFGTYDYYYMSDNTNTSSTSSDNTIPVSNDYIFGVRAALHF